MADELISRHALLKELATHFNMVNGRTLYHPSMALAMHDVRNAPAVDAVEVVRCKDCKHGELNCNLKEKEYVVCELDEHHVWRPNGFCSYGERREENA